MMKRTIMILMTAAAMASSTLALPAIAEAHGHHHRGGHHHNNCHHWRMMPYQDHMVGRWVCGAGRF
jgi:hypothetical protein